jgi:hypothetical protein
MIFVRLVAHINHNWGLFVFQRPFSFITGMLVITVVSLDIGSVELVVPGGFLGNFLDELSEIDLKDYAREMDYKKVIRNDDGTYTLIMTKKRQKERLSEIAEIIDEHITEYTESDDYPYIESIDHADDYSFVTIIVNKAIYDQYIFDFTHIMLGTLAEVYQSFSTNPKNVQVIVQDFSTGEVLVEK